MSMSTHQQKDAERVYAQTIEAVLTALVTTAQNGLSEVETDERLARIGQNELSVEDPVPAWRKFLAQFQNVLVILLLIATAISAGLWLYERKSALPYESIAIFSIVLLNAILGYLMESRAEKAVAALRQMSAAHANVIRDGARQRIEATKLVPGDIILLEEGDTIPADARLIQATSLLTAEASLTGESSSVSKNIALIPEEVGLAERHNMVFSSTAVSYGRGSAVVTATGMQTEIGRIAGMLKAAPDEITPLQKELDSVGRLLGVIVVVIAFVMVTTILLIKGTSNFSAIFDVLILGVALAVAAVPEGLPAVVTAVLSLGVQRMAKRNAIVRHLAAVETLGSANVIASDKTGTLTKNEMAVRSVITASGRVAFSDAGEVCLVGGGVIDGPLQIELKRALTIGNRANNAVLQQSDGQEAMLGDPTEGALLVAARKAGLDNALLETRFKRVGEVPFSSERKLMTTVHTDAELQEDLLVLTKGAPDVLIARCSHELVGEETRLLSEARRKEILNMNESLAGDALRTLAAAFRLLRKETLNFDEIDEKVEHDLVLTGLFGMIDSPRPEAKDAVARAKRAGIRPIMITGDHPITAAVIATELGIVENGRAITGSEIEKASDESLSQMVKEVSVYARVNPEHKLRIVQALQRAGAIVAMTGDGVNDAPALKTSDIGVAMGITGTSVSKEAADIVLADDNFASIVAAVEEGRAIYANIRKFLRYLLSSNFGEVLTMFAGVLLADAIGLTAAGDGGVVLPLLATQILWINLITDGAPALALGVDPGDAQLMLKPPRLRGEGVITRRMWVGILFVGMVMATGTLLVLDASLPGGFIEGSGSLQYAHTMTFTTLTMFQLFNVFNARSDEQSAFHELFKNHWLWGAILMSISLQIAVIYVPFLQVAFSTVNLSLGDWLRCTVVASSVLWLSELTKLVSRTTSR
ncbi:MAG: cation-translocating P-type ATPase [Anaerolineae bacterium]|nr:cation-translocating P-type ATPase [Gloeobacterales cyanobacterium ES-bin-313]